jgi:protein-tyrosine phosphatase
MIDSKITLIAGSETMLHDYLFHYSDLSELCIENTRYLLLELPYTKKWDSKIYNKIRNLIIYYDILPIIAHIERYPAVIRSKKNIIKLIKTGCVIQANTDSIKGKKQKKQKKQLFRYIKKGYIDVLGSDCHNMAYRPPIISDAFEIIIQKFGDRFLDRLIYNADCIINGITLRQVIKNYEIP